MMYLFCLVVSCQVFHLLIWGSIHPCPPALVLCNFIERRATPSLMLHSDQCTLGPTPALWLKVKLQVRPQDPHRNKQNTAREGIVHSASSFRLCGSRFPTLRRSDTKLNLSDQLNFNIADLTKAGLKMSEVCGIICDMKREGEDVLLIFPESSVHVLPSYNFV